MATPSDSTLYLQLLAQMLGLGGRKDATGQAIGSAGLASGIARAGALGPTAANVAGPLGTAAAGAGAGYNLARIAGSDLSTKRKVGEGARVGVDTGLSFLIPYYGLAKAVQAIGSAMQGSGSPQVRGAGRAIDYAAEPAGAKAFWSTVTGAKSLGSALKDAPQQLTLDMMGPVGLIFRGLGIGLPGLSHTPTSGTQFRTGLQSLFHQTGLPAFNRADPSTYNMDVSTYNAFTPEARTAATQLADFLTPLAPKGKPSAEGTPSPYRDQTIRILLNALGEGVTQRAPSILERYRRAA